ncbi:MAG: hemolysin family protein [Planctomycetaceae bacterium]
METFIQPMLLAAGEHSAGASSAAGDLLQVTIALILVAVNGFFVAAEFALVKVRGSQIQEMVRQERPFSGTAQWLVERLDGSLSACQLGITMASLALGWVGEPAFARLLAPVFRAVGITSETAVHTIAFIVAFTAITGLHLVIGEQAPKIFAIRRSEQMVLWCAVPMKLFYIFSYPLLVSLNWTTSLILARFGIHGAGGHSTPHSEDEIRALIREAHIHGDVTRHEHHLLNAVFEFDDMICRKVMVPRVDVEWLDVSQSLDDCIEKARRSRHTRFPLCEGSLDKVVGVVHIKDLIGLTADDDIDLKSLRRPPKHVPETIPISRLLQHFQATRQHLAFVVDEYGSVSGIVTLENVLEQIVGSVEDEFDMETPDIVPDGPGQFIVHGSTAIEKLQTVLNLNLDDEDVDTFSGYLMARAGQIPEAGAKIEFHGATAEILEVRHARAERVRVTLPDQAAGHSTAAEVDDSRDDSEHR